MKTCTRCGETKDLEEFHPQPHGRYGRRSRCKACEIIDNQETRAKKRSRRVPESERCLHGDCRRRGEDLPEGIGFRFCDRHAPAARQVLDHPSGRAFSDGDGNNKEWK